MKQQSLLSYTAPNMAPLARKSDPTTSFTAGDSVSKATRSLARREILALLRHRSLADFEIQQELAHLPVSESRLRTARDELVDDFGLVECVGEKPSPFGRPAQVWRAVS